MSVFVKKKNHLTTYFIFLSFKNECKFLKPLDKQAEEIRREKNTVNRGPRAVHALRLKQ